MQHDPDGPKSVSSGEEFSCLPTHCLAFTAQYANILMGKAAKAYALVAPTHLLVLHFSQNVQDLYQEFPCIWESVLRKDFCKYLRTT